MRNQNLCQTLPKRQLLCRFESRGAQQLQSFMEILMHSQLGFQENESGLCVAGAEKQRLCQASSTAPIFGFELCHCRCLDETSVLRFKSKSLLYFGCGCRGVSKPRCYRGLQPIEANAFFRLTGRS